MIALMDARTITEQKRYGFNQLNASGLDNKTMYEIMDKKYKSNCYFVDKWSDRVDD